MSDTLPIPEGSFPPELEARIAELDQRVTDELELAKDACWAALDVVDRG